MKDLSFASLRHASALVGCGLLFGSVAFGQSSAKLSGRAIDATGRPLGNAVVRLVSDTTAQPGARPWRYTLIGDSPGKIQPGGHCAGCLSGDVVYRREGREHLAERIAEGGRRTSARAQHGFQAAGAGGWVGRRMVDGWQKENFGANEMTAMPSLWQRIESLLPEWLRW